MSQAFKQALKQSRQTNCPLIAVHRGTHAGLVQPNTIRAAKAAVASGGDIVEMDVARSSDGIYFTFHDGYEPLLLATDKSILEMTAAEVESLELSPFHGQGCGRVERFETVVGALRDTFINVDRSWRYWGDGFLTELAKWGNMETLIVKCRAESEPLELLATSGQAFPFIPNVRSQAELDLVLSTKNVNLVGLELIVTHPGDELDNPEIFKDLRERGLAIWFNTINLESGTPRFREFNDEVSIFDHPDKGWGKLRDYHVDIIQTDWPWLAKQYYLQSAAGLTS